MNAHRQDMVNVELTVDEVRDAIDRVIAEKYPFLADGSGWDLQDLYFDPKTLNECHGNSSKVTGARFFFTKDIEVDDPPAKKDCGGGCGNCLKPCR